MRTFLVAIAAAMALTGCSTGTAISNASPESALSSQTSTPSSAPTPEPTATRAAKRAGLCPANPPRNGDLSDQGEQVGKIGATSSTFIDADGKRLYCLVATKVEREPNGVIFSFLLINQAGKPVDLDDPDNSIGLPVVTYGSDGRQADLVGSYQQGDRGDSYFTGVVPPTSRRTAEYAYEVPAGRHTVTVSVLGFAWTGQVD